MVEILREDRIRSEQQVIIENVDWLIKMRVINWMALVTSVATGAGLWLVFGRQLPPQIPIWYSRPWGESQLGPPQALLIMPMLAAGVGLGAGWLGGKMGREPLLGCMLLATSIVVQMMLTLGMLRIVLIVM